MTHFLPKTKYQKIICSLWVTYFVSMKNVKFFFLLLLKVLKITKIHRFDLEFLIRIILQFGTP